MRAAVGTAPPTRIDVEDLISADARRRRHRAWTVAGTGAAAAVAAVLAVPAMLVGPAGTPAAGPPPAASASAVGTPLCDSVTPKASGPQPPLQSHDTVRPRPTETPAEGVGRLSAALREVVASQLPDGVSVESVQPRCSAPQFRYHPSYREYEAGGELRQGESAGWFMVRVAPRPARDEATCEFAPDSRNCNRMVHSDGSISVFSRMPLGDGLIQLSVSVFRPDGTLVSVVTSNGRIKPAGNGTATTVTAREPLLTGEQMIAIGRAPALTLYP
ncbi:hypothetical protein AB0873_27905 [Micromonospora sp. NPDC047707]|uniref:hypothetical protein n=1 Tax=Micromonospora sp. NPDC047707 TaxID=3154498 RepID=UPI00345615AE